MKCISSPFPVTFGPLYSIGSALFPYTSSKIVSLVEAALTRCTSRV